MELIAETPWRVYPTGFIIGVGVITLYLGASRLVRMARVASSDRTAPIQYAGGLRLVFLGLALVGIGSAWMWNQPLLLAAALGIGGVELIETTMALIVLRSRERDYQNEN